MPTIIHKTPARTSPFSRFATSEAHGFRIMVFEPELSRRSLMEGLTAVPMAACVYGLVGAAIGATIMGTKAVRRRKHEQLPCANAQPRFASRRRLFLSGLTVLATTAAILGAGVAWKSLRQFNRQKADFASAYRKKMEREIRAFCSESGRMPNSAQELIQHNPGDLRSPEVFNGIVKFGFNEPTLQEGWLTYERQVFDEIAPLCLEECRIGNTERHSTRD